MLNNFVELSFHLQEDKHIYKLRVFNDEFFFKKKENEQHTFTLETLPNSTKHDLMTNLTFSWGSKCLSDKFMNIRSWALFDWRLMLRLLLSFDWI